MADLDPEDWAHPDPKVVENSKTDVDPPSKVEAAPVGESISVPSSSDWEAATTSGFTFRSSPSDSGCCG